MKTFSKLAASLLISAALAITFSCSSDENGSVDKYKYCVFAEDKLCLEGPFSSCEIGGRLSNSCPYGNGLSISSSSSSSNGLSSIQSSSSRNTQTNSSSSSSSSIQTNISSSLNGSFSSSSSSIVSSSSLYSSSSSLLSSSSNLPSSSSITIISGSFTDTRDNITYKWVKIGNQTWMAENLNYDDEGSACYDNLESNCSIYGRLYDWCMAMGFMSGCHNYSLQIDSKHKGVCPDGWHIPSDTEWSILINYIDGIDSSEPRSSQTAGRYLKTTDSWKNNGNGLDSYGFTVLPSGTGYSNGNFGGIYDNGYFWSTTRNGPNNAYYRQVQGFTDNVFRSSINISTTTITYLYSIRCVKD